MATTTTATRSELNELRRNDGAEQGPQDRSFPEHLAKNYHKDGNSYRSARRPDKIEIVDRGSRMHAYRPVSAFTARVMAEMVVAREWRSAEITGDRDWRSKAYVELASRGVQVIGHEPTDKDKEVVARRFDQQRARSNPKVQAFIQARTGPEMAAVTKVYPDLANAFAIRAAIEKKGAGIVDEKGRDRWIGAMTDNLNVSIDRGDKLPTVAVRDSSKGQADRSSEAPER